MQKSPRNGGRRGRPQRAEVPGLPAGGEDGRVDESALTLGDDAVLQRRLRLAIAWFSLAIPIFGLADWYLAGDRLPWLLALKAVGLLVAGGVLWHLRVARPRRAVIGCALLAVATAAGTTAVSGALVRDPLSMPLVASLLAIVAATTLPWGAAAQAGVAAIGLACIFLHAALLGQLLSYPAVAGVVVVCISVWVAAALARERQLVQSALDAGAERFRATFDQAAVGIAHVAPDGRWLRVNRRLCEIVGYSSEEMLRGNFQDMTHPEDLAADLAHVAELLAGRRDRYAMEKRYRHRDGSVVWVNLTVALVRDRLGAPQYFISVVEDIGARKEAEARVQALNAALQERTHLLEIANAELEGFGYSVSHDLRTPVRTIEGFSRILLEEHAARLDDEGRRLLMRTNAAAVRMHQLIDDLLLLAQVSRREMSRRTVDVSAQAESIVGELREASPERRTEVRIAPGMVADADPNLLRIALHNLLGNAWKYTRRRQPGRIAVAIELVGGEPALCVSDDGAGFDMAYADRLFRPFQRLHSNDEFEGTGIGLAIVERIVRRHGGTIRAEAAPERGAQFVLTLGPGALSLQSATPARASA